MRHVRRNNNNVTTLNIISWFSTKFCIPLHLQAWSLSNSKYPNFHSLAWPMIDDIHFIYFYYLVDTFCQPPKLACFLQWVHQPLEQLLPGRLPWQKNPLVVKWTATHSVEGNESMFTGFKFPHASGRRVLTSTCSVPLIFSLTASFHLLKLPFIASGMPQRSGNISTLHAISSEPFEFFWNGRVFLLTAPTRWSLISSLPPQP